jgi:protein-disulfide isomerase
MDEIPEKTTSGDKAPAGPPGRSRLWLTATWFLLGILIGAVGFAYVSRLTTIGLGLDSQALRQAAREGLLEAIATLQSGGTARPSGSQSATPAPKEFKIREANRLGKKDAPVTVVEFSDFQ